MIVVRRSFMHYSLSLLLLFLNMIDDKVSACNPGKRPDHKIFKNGDLLWPKISGVPIPYSGTNILNERQSWIRDRDNLIKILKLNKQYKIVKTLKETNYDDFFSSYYNGEELNKITPRSASSSPTGHVSMIEVTKDGVPYIIEAMPKQGVRRIKYATWLKERECQVIWHGRIKNLDKTIRYKIIKIAKSFLEKPYEFMGFSAFNLNDSTGFYCSKLVWISVFKASKISLDDKPFFSRLFWVSPKTLLQSSHIKRLNNPGFYSFR